MTATDGAIDFYFDFSSPFGYLASQRIEAIARKHNQQLNWHPILLGFIFKISKQAPLTSFPLKGEYSLMDMHRSARLFDIEYKHPDPFPVGTVAAARTFYWQQQSDEKLAVAFVHALMKAYYVTGKDISNTEEVLTVANNVGIDATAAADAIQTDKIKDLLKTAVDNAIEIGVFGSPTMIVRSKTQRQASAKTDGEIFWGHDRLEQMEIWLERGGW